MEQMIFLGLLGVAFVLGLVFFTSETIALVVGAIRFVSGLVRDALALLFTWG